ncbi:MAG TPA: hypothetical protein DEH78_20440 [Solibacterales bacterium]|nr:hypothetical protein [Bryobacterales bacterium]
MRSRAAVGFLIACGLASAQTAAAPSLLAPVNQRLPKWIKLTGELRAREEGFFGNHFTEGQDDMYLLQRVRLGISLKPVRWFEAFAQGQDARVSFQSKIQAAPPYQDSADLRQAWVQFQAGPEKNHVTFRAGRQELGFGEERLVGAGNWGNVSRTFDALRLGVRQGNYAADVFAASVVVARDHFFDKRYQGDNLHGAYGSISGWVPGGKLEPFVFWRISPAGYNHKTAGLRWFGKLPAHLEYTTEMALQRGLRSGRDVRAWAGLWRLGRTFSDVKWTPSLKLEVNHASGDRDPNDNRYETFDLLYPTPHDKYGLTDQVGWKNINHFGVIGEIKPRKTLAVQFKAHGWWLASARDGLYNAPGALLARDATGQSGRHVGEELDAQVIWNVRPGVQFTGGLGHLFPGEFLKRTTPGRGYTFPYVGMLYGF